MEPLELAFIGSGNAFAVGGMCWNGFVANERYLFDAPPQALMSLNRMGIDPNALEAVIISHHHGDHLLGLPFLLLHWKYLGRTAPVTIVAPPETEAVIREVSRRTYPTLFDTDVEVTWVEARPGDLIRVGGLELEPVEVVHDEKLNLNLGFAARLGGRSFAYTGDSKLCDGVLDLARNTEVLVSECTTRAQRLDSHMNLVDDMPVVRAAMRGDADLVLTHLVPGMDAGGLPRTRVAEDFARYVF